METFCHICRFEVLSIAVIGGIGKAVWLFPGPLHTFCALCIVLQDFWIDKVVEIFVIFELINLLQRLLIKSFPVVMHLIGFPLCWVLVAVWDQATVVPILVHVLLIGIQLIRRFFVFLVFQFQVLQGNGFLYWLFTSSNELLAPPKREGKEQRESVQQNLSIWTVLTLTWPESRTLVP